MSDALDTFLPPVRDWFRQQYGAPTPPQALGWPAIQRGEHTLILSPTGSGKTLAAFLWAINTIFCDLAEHPELHGVQLLYISPLKALNNDIERNLRNPLALIRKMAHQAGQELPPLAVAVRTGDTPSGARQRMVSHPPHILITTPESLYLILTSPRANEMLKTVKTVIVDEIHTLVGNKRGVHLALSLERLGALAGRPVQRIGLSATQRPLDEVARFLVGQEWQGEGENERLQSRPVTIVDAGAQKDLALKVITVVPDLRRLPNGSIWPSLIPQVLNEVRRHHTTLIFTNSRRSAERAADRLNEQYSLEESEEVAPGSPEGLLAGGVPKAQGMFGTGQVGGPFRAHHGSISKEVRLELEQQLKAGELPALIGTSSLELGIDIGTVDLVVQLQSPRSVARGLQRVGRSGHLVGQTSVGHIYATFREDLLDAGAVAHGMLHGEIESTFTPQNCLDVLAQQIVALVALEDWSVPRLYRLVRQAYGYQRLPQPAYLAVLDMLTGRYPSEAFRELRPRIAWDRVHDTLSALPGSRLLAINNGGTIADRGLFNVYLPDRKTLLGTLDEEFVYETRVGDVFTLGAGTWRATRIEEDKIIVSDAAGTIPRMPFWRGDAPRREYEMGLRLGAFRRELLRRVADLPPLPLEFDPLASPYDSVAMREDQIVSPATEDAAQPAPGRDETREIEPVIRWLAEEYAMDQHSARNAILYVRQQWEVMGAISSDKTVIVELFNDALGDTRMAIHSCFGGRVNSAWALVLANAFRDRYRMQVEVQANDDGILFRFVQADRDPPLDIVRLLGPDEARERLLAELPSSALFGSQFRMNAARALLLPGRSGSRRTPFWLQRMRAKDLLAAAGGFGDFPLIAETYRDCLRDVLDLQHLQEVLQGIQSGDIRVVEAETVVPSPVAGSLLFDFIAIQMYEGDLPKVEKQMQALAVNRELLGQLLDEGALPDLLRPEAIAAVEDERQHLAEGYRARTSVELAVMLHELGDLTADEVHARTPGEGRQWLLQLAAEGRAFHVEVPIAGGTALRWIAAEDYARYRDAFSLPEEPPLPLPPELLEPRRPPEAAREAILRVYSRSHGPLTLEAIGARYAFPLPWLNAALRTMAETGYLVSGHLTPAADQEEWCDRRVLERIHRRTLTLLRQEVRAVEFPAYADFQVRWQGLHPLHTLRGREGLLAALRQLSALRLPAALWERDVLPARLDAFRPSLLDALCAEGELVWVASGSGEAMPRHAATRTEVRPYARFLFRGEGGSFLPLDPPGEALQTLSEAARRAAAFLKEQGACYTLDLQRGLGLRPSELHSALLELLLAGIVTNDLFASLRQVLAGEMAPPEAKAGVRSSLDDELSVWRASRPAGPLRRLRPEGLRQVRREAAARAAAQSAPPGRWNGRWSLVRGIGIWGGEASPQDRALRQARQILSRYGIVSRECLQHEEGSWDWATLYQFLQILELRGEVRRGYFVRGLSGVQFALPEALERLRAWNGPEAEGVDALVLLNACDPANLYGRAAVAPGGDGEALALSDGDTTTGPYRFSRLPSNYLVLQRGLPILLYEHGGARWSAQPQMGDETLRRALKLCLSHLTREGGLCSRPRRVLVSTWNGEPPIGSGIQPLLEGLRFRREPPAMVWDGM